MHFTVNPMIYISCIQQFWDSAKLKTVNGNVQIQALIDGKKIIVNEASIRRDLKLDDAEGSPCLPNATIFEELTRIGVKKLEMKRKSRITKLKRLSKVGAARRVESFEDKDSLGDQEDPSKQGRNIADIDQDENVTLIDETQRKLNDEDMFEYMSSCAPTTTIDELTLAQTLIEIKAAKPKTITSVTIATTSVTTAAVTRPKAKGIVFHDQEEQSLKNKDQVAADEELARQLYGEMQAKIAEEERIKRQKEEEANIALIESWDNTQAMMKADFELAQKIQADKQGEITIEERSKLFLKSKSYEEIQKLFDLEMKIVNSFIPMDLDVESSMKARIDIEQESKAEEHNDQEEAELKKHLEIVKDDDIAIDAIPLATKPPVIIEYKIVKEGIIRHFQLIRADRSSKRYSSMIKMLQGIDREDLQTLWKLVKAMHGDTRPEDD
ncbi:hypothetical protein Tco_0343517 [Tanacetum coccineum]